MNLDPARRAARTASRTAAGAARTAVVHLPARVTGAASPGARAGAAYVALMAAHEIGDYILQRDADAVAKGNDGRDGALVCARHVGSYTAAQALALLAADRYLRLGLDWRRAGLALALSGGSHYVIDRCAGHWPETAEDGAPLVVRAAHKAGKSGWLVNDPGAPALIDQALHRAVIGVAALFAAGRR
ncbi:DUF3307 domain-containing protein [Streptomyces sp. NA04227]|uniref:DUF3307 domain-containing protein n=1 Tax=Streptomyces sp. NA04227 TaxID=2742136 RepID=UPI0015924111|nr:DUF3307 domain-containing protein [Streptomyces sp. NA04227]QKW06990.1 DUF3307 domain-containing protein [Streptomyces sp. NA04227]